MDLKDDPRTVADVVRRLAEFDIRGAEYAPPSISDLLRRVQEARLDAEQRVRDYEQLHDLGRTGAAERAAYVRGFEEAITKMYAVLPVEMTCTIDNVRADFHRASQVAVEERRYQDREAQNERAMRGSRHEKADS